MNNIYSEDAHKLLDKKLNEKKLKFENDPKMKHLIDDKIKQVNKNNIIEK